MLNRYPNMENMERDYDVVIVGGGITGTALLYVLAKYTDLKRLALVEKYAEASLVNSHYDNNSQTLHFGDIETNYTLEKASKVKQAAELLAAYLERHDPGIYNKGSKMVLAVGRGEVEELERRFEEFKDLFPSLQKLDREEISRVEPLVTLGRKPQEQLLALLSPDGYAVNYKLLSESFIAEALVADKKIDIFWNEEITDIRKKNGWWHLVGLKGSYGARVVVTAAGPHSLIFAKSLGFGKELGLLPVAGSFYKAYDVPLNGKVYMMQLKKLPFAAVHGDPDVNDPREVRFGPTAKVLPLLERHNYATFTDFLKTSAFTWKGIISLWKVITDKTIFFYVLRNLLYDLPLLGKLAFLGEVKKIIPTITYSQLHYGKGLGGIRPQIINTATGKMEMGEAKLVEENIIFNITPSPGASVCLENARKDAKLLKDFLGDGYHFDEASFLADHRR